MIYLIIGCLIAGYPLAISRLDDTNKSPIDRKWIWGLLLLLGFIVQDICKPLFEIWPLDYKSADMLPIIQNMAERFTEGNSVYAIIPEIWGGMQPIYLPGMWMPFLLSVLGDADVRWTSIFFMFVGSSFLLRPWAPMQWSSERLTSMLILILSLWITWLYLDQSLITLTQEGVVLGYYGGLCWAIIARKPIWIGIAMGLCYCSRYALGPWSIMFIVAAWFFWNKKAAMVIGSTALFTFLFIMSIGQGWSALSTFISVPESYATAVLNDFHKYFPVIDNGLGLAKFWKYESLGSFHTLMKVCAFGIPIVSFLFYKKFKNGIPFELFALLSLKLSLVFFYNLLVMPYTYLFYTSTIVSLGILSWILLPSQIEKEQH